MAPQGFVPHQECLRTPSQVGWEVDVGAGGWDAHTVPGTTPVLGKVTSSCRVGHTPELVWRGVCAVPRCLKGWERKVYGSRQRNFWPQWHMSIILATQEAEGGGFQVWASLAT